MSGVSYPLDTTGLAPTNLIVDEVHTLTEINDVTYRIIIPEFSPFYLDNFVLKHVDSLGVETPLLIDVDYYLCLPYVAASRSIGKMVYGGITINSELIEGTVKVTYQTIGGDWCADASYVLERIAESNYNPRLAVWDQITNKQDLFPPINHSLDIDQTYGHQQLIDSINSLASTIVNSPNPSVPIVQHLIATDNPHNVTKLQVGLGNVENLPLATPDDIANRTPVPKYVTLEQVLQLLQP